MLIESSESSGLFQEFHRVFGGIEKADREQLLLEKRAMDVMREMRKMDVLGKKITQEGKTDKIANFNKKYIALKMELVKIYEKTDQK
jgi:hypothetical protein